MYKERAQLQCLHIVLVFKNVKQGKKSVLSYRSGRFPLPIVVLRRRRCRQCKSARTRPLLISRPMQRGFFGMCERTHTRTKKSVGRKKWWIQIRSFFSSLRTHTNASDYTTYARNAMFFCWVVAIHSIALMSCLHPVILQ